MTRVAQLIALLCFLFSESRALAAMQDAPAAVTSIAAEAPLGRTEAAEAPLRRDEAAAPLVRGLLERDARQTRTWWWGWLGGFGALTVGQGVLGLTTDDAGFRADQYVGAAGSTLGVIGTLIHAVQPYDVAPGADLNALLADRAAREVEGRGWLNHTLNAAVNVASAGVLWGYYDRPGSAAFTFTAGMIIGEAQIWTQPTLARDAKAGEGVTTFSVLPGMLTVRRTF